MRNASRPERPEMGWDVKFESGHGQNLDLHWPSDPVRGPERTGGLANGPYGGPTDGPGTKTGHPVTTSHWSANGGHSADLTTHPDLSSDLPAPPATDLRVDLANDLRVDLANDPPVDPTSDLTGRPPPGDLRPPVPAPGHLEQTDTSQSVGARTVTLSPPSADVG